MLNLFSKQSPWGRRSASIGSVLFVSAMFAACGDEVTEVTKVTQVVGMQMLEEGDALPKCTKDNEGAMVYSVDSAEAYTCVGGTWALMKGEDGKDGSDGKDGKDGADGKDGKDGSDGKNGTNGKDGKNGTNGTNGTNDSSGSSSCTAKALKNGKGYKIVCGGDSVGVVLNGEDGQDGAKGDSGMAGTSCSAKKVSDGVKITCTDGKSFTLKNGADGKDGKSFVEGVLIDPRDKQIYRVVTIGEQTWMAENLNYATAEGSYCYGETASDPKTENCTKYGRLYIWTAAIDSVKLYKDKALYCGYGRTCSLPDTVYGICPTGWHLPDNTEWKKLYNALGGNSTASKMLKSQTGWNHNGSGDGTGGGNGTDAYGFSAFPAGYRDYDGYFYREGNDAVFWSATEDDSDNAYSWVLSYYDRISSLLYNRKDLAFSVRCIKD